MHRQFTQTPVTNYSPSALNNAVNSMVPQAPSLNQQSLHSPHLPHTHVHWHGSEHHRRRSPEKSDPPASSVWATAPSGALAGAVYGSLFGPVGTGIGAVIGLTAGTIGGIFLDD